MSEPNGVESKAQQPSETDVKKAEEFKEKGNKLFKEQKYLRALDMYSSAIEADPSNAIYYCNRAFCHIKLENNGLAILDADKGIQLNPRFVKNYYRRGSAHLALNKHKLALKDFQTVVRLCPKDLDASKRLRECQKAIDTARFLKAIENENSKPVSEVVKLDDMVVDPSYQGPHLPEVMTLDFVKATMQHFKDQKMLPKKYVYDIVLQMIKLLSKLPTLVDVDTPAGHEITVCGDVHGQYYDVLNIFELNGLPSPTNPYLFNGDFVDRGSFSLEVILTFFCLKLLYPDHMHLTRGNHESLSMNQSYGFRGEVIKKVDETAFDLFSECFNYLPLAYVLNKKVLVVHGGLFSEDGVKLSDIKAINRNQQPPEKGLMCELMWSDPQPHNGRAPSKRGVGLAFGPDVTKRFLDDNKLDMVVRSHEVKEEGYHVEADGRLVTIFSAPNYCDSMGNKGAFIRFQAPEMKPKFTQFTAVPHPSIAPMAYASPIYRM